MEITKITCSMGRTINLGNYESLRVDFGLEAIINEKDDRHVAQQELASMVSVGLEDTVRVAKGSGKPKHPGP